MTTSATPLPDAHELRRRFDGVGDFTVGVEEETMLLDSETLELAPLAGELLRRLEDDVRFKPELPATQLEIATAPAPSAVHAVAQLASARRDLAAAADGLVLPAVAGVHPFSAAEGVLTRGARYDVLHGEYGVIARRQLVAGLQVHVAVGGADRTLAVYNALRAHLPALAALAANAPIHDGRDSGLASVRPTIAGQLPRQGVPPPLESWEQFADELRWGAHARTVSEPRMWWWELRPHAAFGTLELRVPDAQTTVAEAAGVIAIAQALVATLAERHDAGESLPVAPTWRIEENRWSALRHGIDGTMADLLSGRPVPTREHLTELLQTVTPAAKRLGSGHLLAHTAASIDRNGAIRQREILRERGIDGLTRWLADRFCA
jgi:carboxylate-amine ligase